MNVTPCPQLVVKRRQTSNVAHTWRPKRVILNMISLLFLYRLQFKHQAKGGFDERVSFLDETTYQAP